MAQRRMFSKQIVQTDAFMDMPVSSQLLYFHLAMEADDDGFVSSPRRIMKLIGSPVDDYNILLAKRFILQFESGICVIKHWRIHNYIQSDRYTETKYLEEKKALELKENGAYTECIQDVSISDTQVRLGKVSIGKVSKEESTVLSPTISYGLFGEFLNVKLSHEENYKLIEKIGEKNTNLLIEELSGYLKSTGKKYASHYATLLNWARRKVQTHTEKLETKKKWIA